jgi:uncharacterized protein (DUF2147 family)
MGSNSGPPARRCLPALLLLVAALGLPPAGAAADLTPTQILGNWLTEHHDGIIEVSLAADGTHQGRIAGGNAPQRLDSHNPDESKRDRPLLGQFIVKGMKYDGEGKWSGGTIYDPDNGRSYKCRWELLDAARLQVRGFIGFSLLGRSQVWTRYQGTSMTLPPRG